MNAEIEGDVVVDEDEVLDLELEDPVYDEEELLDDLADEEEEGLLKCLASAKDVSTRSATIDKTILFICNRGRMRKKK